MVYQVDLMAALPGARQVRHHQFGPPDAVAGAVLNIESDLHSLAPVVLSARSIRRYGLTL